MNCSLHSGLCLYAFGRLSVQYTHAYVEKTLTIMWLSCNCHVTIMWLSCDYHVTVMWLSCDLHSTDHNSTEVIGAMVSALPVLCIFAFQGGLGTRLHLLLLCFPSPLLFHPASVTYCTAHNTLLYSSQYTSVQLAIHFCTARNTLL